MYSQLFALLKHYFNIIYNILIIKIILKKLFC